MEPLIKNHHLIIQVWVQMNLKIRACSMKKEFNRLHNSKI